MGAGLGDIRSEDEKRGDGEGKGERENVSHQSSPALIHQRTLVVDRSFFTGRVCVQTLACAGPPLHALACASRVAHYAN